MAYYNFILSDLYLYLFTAVEFIVVAVVVVAFVVFLFRFFSRQLAAHNQRKGVLLEIILPKERHVSDAPNEKVSREKTKTSVAEQMFAELHSLINDNLTRHFLFQPAISFEVVAMSGDIRFYCFCPKKDAAYITNIIYAAYPEADIQETQQYLVKDGLQIAEGCVRLNGPDYAPIRTYETMVVDPLNALLNAIGTLEKDELVSIQTLVTPVDEGWRSKAYSFLNSLKQDILSPGGDQLSETTSLIASSITGSEGKSQPEIKTLDKELYLDVERKMSRPGFKVSIRVLVAAASASKAQTVLDNVSHSYSIFDEPPLTKFVLHNSRLSRFNFISNFFLRMSSLFDLPFHRLHFYANTIELATLFHFPGEEIETPHIVWLSGKHAPAPSNIPLSGILLGTNSYRGVDKPIYIKDEDRKRHMYIVGQTGTGKTEFLKHLILEDIKAGNGVCFIDPHGDAAEDILGKIPAERIKDTIYWDPSDVNYPFGLNIMEAGNDEEKNKIINSFIAMLYKMYDPSHVGIMGPLIERAIRNVMLTAMEEKENTLVEVLRLLTSPEFASKKIPLIKDKLVKTYWTEELAHTNDFHKSETLGYFVSKFDRFVTDKLIRNIIGQSTSSFDFKDIMNNKKILIINLSKGKLGEENSKFLGLLLIPKILLAAMSRANLAEKERNEFYLYVDEFQNFATPDFAEIMSEARKYGLSLTVAHQYMSQIEEDIRNAIIGNVGTICAFRIGADDAKYLVPQFQPICNEYDLTNSSIGNIYIKLLIDGKPSMPFSMSLDWDNVSKGNTTPLEKELITSLSQVDYGMPKAAVDMEINHRAGLE